MILYGGLDSLLVASIAARHFAGTKSTKLCEAQLQSFCVGLDVYLLPLITDYIKLFLSTLVFLCFTSFMGQGSPDLKAGKEVADYLEVLTKSFTSLFRYLTKLYYICLLHLGIILIYEV